MHGVRVVFFSALNASEFVEKGLLWRWSGLIEPRGKVDVVLANNFCFLVQLNGRLEIHICDVLKILEIFGATFTKRVRKLLQGCTQELEQVAQYYV